ncbi:MAG: hypothetical protein MI867_05160, partial [Pseudomonadales bacterium]|nr:hypothetical protein [Pseudomonadales bacterium]
VIRPALDGKVEVLFSDTDSFLLLAEASSSDEVMHKLSSVVDTSNYPEDHPLYDASRKYLTGYLKNEMVNSNITTFVGLRSKCYAFKTDDNYTVAKAKGVKTCYKKKIKFEQFKECIDTISSVEVKQTSIQAKDHQNLLVQSVKCSMTSFDDKRFLLCPIHSVPYGSVLIDLYKSTKKCYYCVNPFHLGE